MPGPPTRKEPERTEPDPEFLRHLEESMKQNDEALRRLAKL
jgi:hypothetical protein